MMEGAAASAGGPAGIAIPPAVPTPSPASAALRLRGGSGSARIAVPVQPAGALYVRFKHIVGVPSHDGLSGVSIFRLRILDNLIDRFLRQKGLAGGTAGEPIQVEPEAVDTLIGALQADLHASATGASAAVPAVEPGMIMSLFA